MPEKAVNQFLKQRPIEYHCPCWWEPCDKQTKLAGKILQFYLEPRDREHWISGQETSSCEWTNAEQEFLRRKDKTISNITKPQNQINKSQNSNINLKIVLHSRGETVGYDTRLSSAFLLETRALRSIIYKRRKANNRKSCAARKTFQQQFLCVRENEPQSCWKTPDRWVRRITHLFFSHRNFGHQSRKSNNGERCLLHKFEGINCFSKLETQNHSMCKTTTNFSSGPQRCILLKVNTGNVELFQI